MSKLTELINQLSSEIAATRISNEEFRRIQHILLEMRVEVRQSQTATSSFSITAGGASTNIGVDWNTVNVYNTSDVVV